MLTAFCPAGTGQAGGTACAAAIPTTSIHTPAKRAPFIVNPSPVLSNDQIHPVIIRHPAIQSLKTRGPGCVAILTPHNRAKISLSINKKTSNGG